MISLIYLPPSCFATLRVSLLIPHEYASRIVGTLHGGVFRKAETVYGDILKKEWVLFGGVIRKTEALFGGVVEGYQRTLLIGSFFLGIGKHCPLSDSSVNSIAHMSLKQDSILQDSIRNNLCKFI